MGILGSWGRAARGGPAELDSLGVGLGLLAEESSDRALAACSFVSIRALVIVSAIVGFFKEEIASRRGWYALTPDLDVYSHSLSETRLFGFVALPSSGTLFSESEFGNRWRAASAACSDDWEPTELEVCAAPEAMRPRCLSVPDVEKPSRRTEGKTSFMSSPAAAAATSVVVVLYPRWLVGLGALPDAGGLCWFTLSAEDATQLRQAVRHKDFDGYLIVDKDYTAAKGRECLLAKAVDPAAPGTELETGARMPDIQTRSDGSRHRHSMEAARQVAATERTEWPITSPRTASRRLEFLARLVQHPRARLTKWVDECRLEATDESVGDHDLAMRLAELGPSFDELNLGKLAPFQPLMRKAQMAEWRHRDRLAAAPRDDLVEERRMAKEERPLSRSGGGGGVAGSEGSKAELRRKIRQPAAEQKKFQDE
ncbi:unnamed protein product, partial [Prorocentrum cordatum]